MQTQSSDTSWKAEQAQIELLREAAVARRIDLAWSLSETAVRLSRRAIQRCHPEWTSARVDLDFVDYHYGQELASSVSRYLESLNA